jgi:outer membrane lipoprotein SlyB
MRKVGLIILVLVIGIAGCTTTQKGAATGAAVGAGIGAIIGHQSGETAEGALIGAAAGGLAGALIGEQMDTMFCPTCGRHFPAGTRYCPYDGTELKPIRK